MCSPKWTSIPKSIFIHKDDFASLRNDLTENVHVADAFHYRTFIDENCFDVVRTCVVSFVGASNAVIRSLARLLACLCVGVSVMPRSSSKKGNVRRGRSDTRKPSRVRSASPASSDVDACENSRAKRVSSDVEARTPSPVDVPPTSVSADELESKLRATDQVVRMEYATDPHLCDGVDELAMNVVLARVAASTSARDAAASATDVEDDDGNAVPASITRVNHDLSDCWRALRSLECVDVCAIRLIGCGSSGVRCQFIDHLGELCLDARLKYAAACAEQARLYANVNAARRARGQEPLDMPAKPSRVCRGHDVTTCDSPIRFNSPVAPLSPLSPSGDGAPKYTPSWYDDDCCPGDQADDDDA